MTSIKTGGTGKKMCGVAYTIVSLSDAKADDPMSELVSIQTIVY